MFITVQVVGLTAKNSYYRGMDELTAKFNRAYANIPLGMRGDVALTLDGKPISWDAAYIEVSARSEFAQRILNKLKELKII
jgi:hypothetical protein